MVLVVMRSIPQSPTSHPHSAVLHLRKGGEERQISANERGYIGGEGYSSGRG